jgi:hypothetical protein
MPTRCSCPGSFRKGTVSSQTRRWSEGDSNSWSHPERLRSEGASHRPPFNRLDEFAPGSSLEKSGSELAL